VVYTPYLYDNLEKLREHYRTLHSKPGTRWMFRGQLEATSLKSSLERVVERFEKPYSEMQDIEHRLLREFKRHFHRYSDYLPAPNDKLEWFAFMQHHGAPTRLLDWTYSFDVALFFAIENASRKKKPQKPHPRIYAIDHNHCWKVIHNFHPDIKNKLADWGAHKDKDTEVLNEILDLKESLVCPLNAMNLNARQAIQQGVFLAPCNLILPFEASLEGTLSYGTDGFHMFELDLSGDFLLQCLERLQRVNITSITLFPGIDGFARSLANRIPLEYLWPTIHC
jgi:hypothetical protein